jgi:hypothetical protein
MNNQIDAASRDITRNLRENELTGNASAAIGGMNMGSSMKQKLDFGSGQRAADRIADVSSNLRGNAYNQGLGIEANRASQNAGFQQAGNQYNASAANALTSQGLGIAGNQAGMNAGFNQQTNMANQNAQNQFLNQGVGVAANAASQNAGFNQQANQANMGAQNQFRGQGYQIGASQLDSNLGRQQQANASNQNAYNSAMNFGTNLGQNAFNSNVQNQQFGAGMAQSLGQQGVNNMSAGQGMMNTGIGMQQQSGDQQRAYQQQLLANQYQQGMSPYNSLNFYNSVVGAPNNLNEATSTSKGSGGSMSLGFG